MNTNKFSMPKESFLSYRVIGRDSNDVQNDEYLRDEVHDPYGLIDMTVPKTTFCIEYDRDLNTLKVAFCFCSELDTYNKEFGQRLAYDKFKNNDVLIIYNAFSEYSEGLSLLDKILYAGIQILYSKYTDLMKSVVGLTVDYYAPGVSSFCEPHRLAEMVRNVSLSMMIQKTCSGELDYETAVTIYGFNRSKKFENTIHSYSRRHLPLRLVAEMSHLNPMKFLNHVHL